MNVDIGVTATRRGLTAQQLSSAAQSLQDMRDVAEGLPTLRHGCCVGGDEQLHRLARLAGYRIVGHPPTDRRWMAEGLDCDLWMDPLPFLDRNHVIVDRCLSLWAFPGQVTELGRGSGTWATIRYAAKLPREGSIVFPDGTLLGLEDWVRMRR